jgi:hypothetical protein
MEINNLNIKENIINNISNNNNITKLNFYEKEYIIKAFDSNSPMVNEIQSLIKDVYNDNVLDYHDIPHIILSITKISSNYFVYNNNIDPYNILKFITECIIFSYLTSVSESEIIIIDKVITISIDLIKVSPNIFKSKYNCFSFCKKRS